MKCQLGQPVYAFWNEIFMIRVDYLFQAKKKQHYASFLLTFNYIQGLLSNCNSK